MKELQVSRRQVLKGAGAIGVLSALAGPEAVLAADTRIRWDLVSIDFTKGTVSAGGHDSAMAQDGSSITLTGSGTFVPGDPDDVTGGGTWTGSAGSGSYWVRRLVSWNRAPGTFPPLSDNIGNKADAHAGLAMLRIRYSNGMRGVLVVSCHLIGTPATVFEGIRVSMGFVDYWNGTAPVAGVDGNRTVFHTM